MKKNIVGHMAAPKETRRGFWNKLDIFARLLCLILALLIWLSVVHVDETQSPPPSTPEDVTVEA